MFVAAAEPAVVAASLVSGLGSEITEKKMPKITDGMMRITDGSKTTKARYWIRSPDINQHTDPTKVTCRFKRTEGRAEGRVGKSDTKFTSPSKLVDEAGVYWVHSSDWERGNSQYRVAAFLGDEHLHTWIAV